MPELPEVETVRRSIRPVLLGRRLLRFSLRLQKLVQVGSLPVRRVVGSTVTSISRRAKLLLIGFSNGYTLVIHLKMTGQIIVRAGDGHDRIGGHPIPKGEQDLPNRYTRAIWYFDRRTTLYFNDVRKFGYLRCVKTGDLPQLFSKLRLGSEPLDSRFTLAKFMTLAKQRPKKMIKEFLLDQTGVAGLGNIYADEVDFAARLHPQQRLGSLRQNDIKAVYQAIRRILRFAVTQRGTTLRNYRDGKGRQGGMQFHLAVYGRTGRPCPRCATLIVREKIGSRSAHFCPHCQRPHP